MNKGFITQLSKFLIASVETNLCTEEEKGNLMSYAHNFDETPTTQPQWKEEPEATPIGCDGCNKTEFDGEPIRDNLYWCGERRLWLCSECYEDSKGVEE